MTNILQEATMAIDKCLKKQGSSPNEHFENASMLLVDQLVSEHEFDIKSLVFMLNLNDEDKYGCCIRVLMLCMIVMENDEKNSIWG